ncbi:MAG TPA: hypothetical protein VMN57_00550 [Anaerolineales bacterium]|nr:hypothetical protein [Anaerolineales bacterium]
MQQPGTRQRLIAIFSLVLILLSMSFGTILMKMVLFEVKPLPPPNLITINPPQLRPRN